MADKVRHCGFCNSEATTTLDTERRREYTCTACAAVERISKGQSWWYWGWTHPDGRKLRSPTVQEMNRGIFGWQPVEAQR